MQTAEANGADAATHAATPISLPKGGGAIRGIGEKFAANPVTGTASMTVPIALSPGRSGFGPQLSLAYDSGSGNGPFGFGWSLDLPRIARKTDKGLPQYRDAEESDVFVLSGAEDLVPVLRKDAEGSWLLDAAGVPVIDDDERDGYAIRPYRPRVEGLFARIERWTRLADGDVHWRSWSRDNILTLYGRDENSRIADPEDSRRIFTWLICETRDDRGNAVVYKYTPEDGAGADLSLAHERNRGARDDARRAANRYLKRIHYGNRVPVLDEEGERPRFLAAEEVDGARWMFEVVLDYGEHDADAPAPDDAGEWSYRDDPFSSYRSCFEVRTARLCQRVLMFHHFPGEPGVGDDCLVRSTDFTYSQEIDPADASNSIYSFLVSVAQQGYVREGDGYLRRSLPPVEYRYTRPSVQDVVKEVDAESLENLPVGIDQSAYQWADLHGEGIPGILTEQGGTLFYKRNLSPISARLVEFAAMEQVALHPNVTLSKRRGAQLMDLAGDGQPDLVLMEGPTPGLYEHGEQESWEPFRPFAARLNRDLRDPNLRFVDLDGDGRADLLITEEDAFVWHASLGEQGFGAARRVSRMLDEEKGPHLVFADGTQSTYLADMTGDGLTDLVRIRNGEVCYWPNLGYGRFGAKVTMDDAPHFDHPDRFEHSRIRLADIDGSGTTDIIYLHSAGVRLYFNQCGNSWSTAQVLPAFPRVDELASVAATDLMGNGTACLVWSSRLPGIPGARIRYVNLMGAKPHLLIATLNNLGVETHIGYASSTRFYLEDKRAGRPWITRLAFPVHVVDRVETIDAVSGNCFVTRYAYHHGYFDGEEREFRGFGMVEQWDTEHFAALTADGAIPDATNIDAASHVPPVLTRTWFHTGIFRGRDRVSNYFAGLHESHRGEYFREPGLDDDGARRLLLPDTVLPPLATVEEEREACRSLKGAMLRREVYALDGTDKESIPYTVSESNYTIEPVQPRGPNRHSVYFTHVCEAVVHNYERDPVDPRTSHVVTLEVDAYGNPQRVLAIGYGRRIVSDDPALTGGDKARQATTLVTYTATAYTNAIWDEDSYRLPAAAETRMFELTGFTPENAPERFSFDELTRGDFALLAGAESIAFDAVPSGLAPQRRLIEASRVLYRADLLMGLLPLGTIESRALPGEAYRLAFTATLPAGIFRRTREGQPDELLLPDPPGPLLEGSGGDEGGYVVMDGDWWASGGQVFLHPDADVAHPANTAAQELAEARAHFYQQRKATDAFGNATRVDRDANDLLLVRSIDALGNTVVATNDYRLLQARMLADPNGNRTALAFDAVGMVVATAIIGKEGEDAGDLLEGFDADPPLADVQAFAVDPQGHAAAMLGKATRRIVYDLDRYPRTGQPMFAATLARETHFHDSGEDAARIQVTFSYSDGLGREIQRKVPAEPGDAPQRGPVVALPGGDVRPGDLVLDGDGDPVPGHAAPRWVGTGRTVYNNKGNPVRKYEPFFASTHLCETEREMTETGVSSVAFHDPAERVVAMLHPDATYEKVVFGPWHQTTYDANDTVAAVGTQTGDPRTDADIAGFVAAYFASQAPGWKTWHAQRVAKAPGDPERDAAEKAAAHADTPTAIHFDALGRHFLTIVSNKYERGGAIVEESNATRVELDLQGKQRSVTDALGRIVARYDYDLLGQRLHESSMEAGERWTLRDAGGMPIRGWNSRGFERRQTFDVLRRPVALFVADEDGERLALLTEYGEAQGAGLNHRGRKYKVRDGAGVATNVAFDFKGNLLEARRELLSNYRDPVDWLLDPAVDGGTFTASTSFDAFNRPVTSTLPDGSIQVPTFNEANLLEKVDIHLGGAIPATHFAIGADHDARGQRLRIEYGNGSITECEYDLLTKRLARMTTTRTDPGDDAASPLLVDPTVVQDLRYTYDAVGNVTRIDDVAQGVVFHDGEKIEASCRYTYDARYRLVEARGREHIGQNALVLAPPNGYRDHPFAGAAAGLNDMNALRGYVERYEYDAVGNIGMLRHVANAGTWNRRYDYEEGSLLEAGKHSNRLTRTALSDGIDHDEPCTYDAHGNVTSMAHLEELAWDSDDRLTRVDRGGGGSAFYQCDGAGTRVRKVIETADGRRVKERIYLGGYELYREFNPAGDTTLQRESIHVIDDGRRIALVETKDGEKPLIRYQLGNHLGSAALELDQEGALISYEEYHPYGTSALQAGRSAAEVSLKRYRYIGKERDEETGFGCFGARYYVPWLGRWASADPAGLADGPNPYQYGQGNPITFVDPGGTQCDPTIATCPELMGNWSYGESVPDRASLGHNVQRDHPIQVQLRAEQRGGRYSRSVSAARDELTVLAETGRGRFHTEVGRLQAEIVARVRAGTITSESEVIEATREAYRLAGEATGTTVNAAALDRAIISNLATLSETASQTASELRDLGVTAADFPLDADFDRGICDPSPPPPLEPPPRPPETPPVSTGATRVVDPETPPAAPAAPEPSPVAPAAGEHPVVPVEDPLTLPIVAEPPPVVTPGRLARAGQWTMEAAPRVLTFVGRVLTVVGAAQEADATYRLEMRNGRGELNATLMWDATAVVGILAGVVDDAYAAAETGVAGAPVTTMDSWDAHGSGPTQHLAGELIRGFLDWGAHNGL